MPLDLHLRPDADRLFRAILESAGVTQADGTFTAGFRDALACRDLLEARLWFCLQVAPDVHNLLPQLLEDLPQFMGRARTFELFRYDRAIEITEANLQATAEWVRYTTALTRYEARGAIDLIDFSHCRRLLDVGGNSGEFARQVTARWVQIEANVFDLPAVCELGRRHVSARDRVGFVPGDLRRDALPPDQDAISFKSMLHDWPDDDARAFLGKAFAALKPGGMLLIYERGEIAVEARLPFWMVANLVFLPFFRAAGKYAGWLAELGFGEAEISHVDLDIPFHLIVARKPA